MPRLPTRGQVCYTSGMQYRLRPHSIVLPVLFGVLLWLLTDNAAIGAAVFAVVLMPAIVALYIPYAQDNPKHFWFKRKLYGWGWTPVTWQGWLTTFGYIGLVAAFALTIDQDSPPQEIAFTFALPVVLLTATFIRIAYKKGESPRWQWGRDGE